MSDVSRECPRVLWGSGSIRLIRRGVIPAQSGSSSAHGGIALQRSNRNAQLTDGILLDRHHGARPRYFRR